jgi:cytochrome c biogenesis protein CcdA
VSRSYTSYNGDGGAGITRAFGAGSVSPLLSAAVMGSLIKKRRKRMRKKKHKKMLKRTRFQRRAKK